jgi:hypothetical protein
MNCNHINRDQAMSCLRYAAGQHGPNEFTPLETLHHNVEAHINHNRLAMCLARHAELSLPQIEHPGLMVELVDRVMSQGCVDCGAATDTSCDFCQERACEKHLYCCCSECRAKACGNCFDKHAAESHWTDGQTSAELRTSAHNNGGVR